MRRSEERILTTHAGSLPRPPELTRLYARRAARRAGRPGRDRGRGPGGAAVGRAKQIEAGIDVGNNGEQQREASSSTCSAA